MLRSRSAGACQIRTPGVHAPLQRAPGPSACGGLHCIGAVHGDPARVHQQKARSDPTSPSVQIHTWWEIITPNNAVQHHHEAAAAEGGQGGRSSCSHPHPASDHPGRSPQQVVHAAAAVRSSSQAVGSRGRCSRCCSDRPARGGGARRGRSRGVGSSSRAVPALCPGERRSHCGPGGAAGGHGPAEEVWSRHSALLRACCAISPARLHARNILRRGTPAHGAPARLHGPPAHARTRACPPCRRRTEQMAQTGGDELEAVRGFLGRGCRSQAGVLPPPRIPSHCL